MGSAPESLTEYRAILRVLGIENKSVTGTCAADHQPFALRGATQFGLESNPASGVGPTRPLRPHHALSSFLKSGVREGAEQRMMPPMQSHETGLFQAWAQLPSGRQSGSYLGGSTFYQ